MQDKTRPRVLCVEDDEDSREMLTVLLGLEEIETETVASATQALSAMRAEHFDLYLLDSRLPEIDGLELCGRIRAIDRSAPILFFSGAARETDRKRAIDAGATAYIVKPDINSLISTVTQFVKHAAKPTARVIPFVRRNTLQPSFMDGPRAA